MSIDVNVEPSIKLRVENMIRQLPANCTLDDIFYHLEVLRRLEERIRMADDPSTAWVSQEDAEKRMAKWIIE